MINYKLLNGYANRGMNLEDDLNNTNKYYKDKDIALIYKKPTPITINKVNYSGKNAIITEAFFKEASTTDYNGIYKGKYIDYDAKEVKNLNYFNLSNLKTHQLEHLLSVKKHGGIAFLIVRFISINKTYLIYIDSIDNFIKNNNRKSIPIEYFDKYGYVIPLKYTPRLDYLKIIDNLLEEI